MGQELQRDMAMQLEVFGFLKQPPIPPPPSFSWNCDKCEMVWPIMAVFPKRDFPADLFEKVEYEVDLVHRGILFCARGLQHGEAFAVGVQVEVIVAARGR